ncbi:glycosyltransferase family 2 protein [Shewanella baltica]|uniref:glycosyltransferase family 2 protein n=1 Tax=Shewanella baltica TaxID=62322 RepID=UPI003D797101
MKYSVIIPFYNQEGLVEETILSVLSAIGQKDEVIAIDDHSTDSTWEKLNSLTNDDRLKIFRNEVNRRHVYTINRAAELSSGEVLILLGGDDILAKNFTKHLTSHFDAGADIVFSPVKFFYNYNDIDVSETSNVPLKALSFNELLFGWGSINGRKYSIIGCAIRKSSFSKLGGFSLSYIVEDHEFFLRAALNRMNILMVSGAYSFYRQTSNSLSKNILKMIREDARIIFKLAPTTLAIPAFCKRLSIFAIVFVRRLILRLKL